MPVLGPDRSDQLFERFLTPRFSDSPVFGERLLGKFVELAVRHVTLELAVPGLLVVFSKPVAETGELLRSQLFDVALQGFQPGHAVILPLRLVRGVDVGHLCHDHELARILVPGALAYLALRKG